MFTEQQEREEIEVEKDDEPEVRRSCDRRVISPVMSCGVLPIRYQARKCI